MKNEIQKLHAAVSAIASRCDGADAEDGVGFNGTDAHFGRSIATKPVESWTPKMVEAASKMIRKYKRQLATMGIDISDLSEDLSDSLQVAATFKADAAPSNRRVEFLANTAFKVSFAYSAEVVSSIKNIPWKFRSFSQPEKCWLVKFEATEGLKDALDAFETFISENAFSVDTETREALRELRKQHEAAEETREALKTSSRATDADLDLSLEGGELMPFQKAGVSYANKAKRAFIADEMGLGKTIQAIAFLESNKAFPALIVAPSNLQENWRRELEKWLPSVSVSTEVFTETPVDVMVLTHHQVRKQADFLATEVEFRGMIIDESHRMKNPKAAITKAVMGIKDGIEFRLLLTGTPIENRPKELISQLQILDRLNDLGGWSNFTSRYCAAYRDHFGLNIDGASNTVELNEKLRETCFVRRLKKEVLTEMPEKVRSVVTVEISNRAEYNRAKREIKADLETIQERTESETVRMIEEASNLDADGVFDMIKKAFKLSEIQLLTMKRDMTKDELVRWIADTRAEKEANIWNAEAIMLINKLKRVAADGKLKAYKEWASQFAESGEKLISFAYGRATQQTLASELPDAVYTRSAKFSCVQDAVDAFQSDDAVKNIVCSLKGDNAGLTMTAASHVGFLELGWTPSEHDQAEDRAHRIGQKNTVNAYYFVAKGTIDEDIWSLLESKRKVTGAIHDGGDQGESSVTVKELVDTLLT